MRGVVRKRSAVDRCRRAAPCSAGRTGCCGAGAPAMSPFVEKWTTNSDGEKRLRRSLAAAWRPRSWPEHVVGVDHVGVGGDRVEAAASSRFGCGRHRLGRPRSRSARPDRRAGARRRAARNAGPCRRPAHWCRRGRTRLRRPVRACGSARRWRWSSSDCRRPAGCGRTKPGASFSLRTKPETIE